MTAGLPSKSLVFSLRSLMKALLEFCSGLKIPLKPLMFEAELLLIAASGRFEDDTMIEIGSS